MSYSRWGNSRWYTFWSSIGSMDMEFRFPTKKLKDKQVFEICDIPSFFIVYDDITTKNIENILEEVKEFYSKSYEVNLLTSFDENKNPIYTLQNTTVNIPTKEELTELKTYLINFKEDIDNHFKFWNFMKFEWYYPIRNKFFFKIKKLILNRK